MNITNTKPIKLSKVFPFLCILFMLSVPSALFTGPNGAIVTRLNGNAIQTKSSATSAWSTVKLGDVLPNGNEIKTGKNSSAILVWNKLEFRIGQNSMIKINSLANKGHSKIHLSQGQSWFHLKKGSNQNLSVSTPTTIAAVRGTKFSLIHHDHKSIACVCEGKVDTTTNGKTMKLQTGDSVLTSKSDSPVKHDYSKMFAGLTVKKEFMEQPEFASMQYCMTCHKTKKQSSSGSNKNDDDYDF